MDLDLPAVGTILDAAAAVDPGETAAQGYLLGRPRDLETVLQEWRYPVPTASALPTPVG